MINSGKKLKKIAITGGKGGTGKSTVAILLANKFTKEGKKVVLVDCDVECPNDYLILGQNLKRPVKRVYTQFPKLEQAKCKKCGLCVKSCKNNSIFQAPGQYPIFLEELCSGCGVCWSICPNQAIKAKKREIGKIFINQIKNLYLITGIAKPVLEETSPVVRGTKDYALDFANKVKADYIIFDTAAGTHCSVIMALLDNDLAYAVTEPTPMGAYDLDLILNLCRKLKIPVQTILNRADLGNKKVINKVTKKYRNKIVEEIPYSKELVKSYSIGDLLNFNYNLKHIS